MAFRITELTSSSNSSKQAHAKSMALALSRSHVPIVHCVAKTTSILRIIDGRFIKFCNSGLMSNSSFASQIFLDSHSLAYTFVGHNFMFSFSYIHYNYTDHVLNVAKIIRSIRYAFGPVSPFEELIVRFSS